jgi:hypothetical protein
MKCSKPNHKWRLDTRWHLVYHVGGRTRQRLAVSISQREASDAVDTRPGLKNAAAAADYIRPSIRAMHVAFYSDTSKYTTNDTTVCLINTRPISLTQSKGCHGVKSISTRRTCMQSQRAPHARALRPDRRGHPSLTRPCTPELALTSAEVDAEGGLSWE